MEKNQSDQEGSPHLKPHSTTPSLHTKEKPINKDKGDYTVPHPPLQTTNQKLQHPNHTTPFVSSNTTSNRKPDTYQTPTNRKPILQTLKNTTTVNLTEHVKPKKPPKQTDSHTYSYPSLTPISVLIDMVNSIIVSASGVLRTTKIKIEPSSPPTKKTEGSKNKLKLKKPGRDVLG